MFSGSSIGGLIELLDRRNARIYHACQYLDFGSYLEVGGVPSRQLLVERGLPFTGFNSDTVDQQVGVWDKVFGNLQDLGWFFAMGKRWTPTVYGPILLVMRPSCLRKAEDVAICLRSATASAFDRATESLDALEDVDRLYQGDTPHIRRPWELRDEFRLAGSPERPEISVTVQDGLLSFDHLDLVRVDPYPVGSGERLVDVVRQAVSQSPYNLRVFERDQVVPDRRVVHEELWKRLSVSAYNLTQLHSVLSAGNELHAWATAIEGGHAEFQFNASYMPYLRRGTILPILEERTGPDLEDLPF